MASEMRAAALARATPAQLATLAPLAGLSPERLSELAQVTVVERAQRGSDPLKERLDAQQSIFLLQGELLLSFEGGGTLVVVGGTQDTRQALNRQPQRLARSKAITDVDLLAVDDDVLDILATWDQVAAAGAESSIMGKAVRSDARMVTGAFSLGNLRSGAFAQLRSRIHDFEALERLKRGAATCSSARVTRGLYYVVESDDSRWRYGCGEGRAGGAEER